MCFIKSLFWEDEDVVVPAKSECMSTSTKTVGTFSDLWEWNTDTAEGIGVVAKIMKPQFQWSHIPTVDK